VPRGHPGWSCHPIRRTMTGMDDRITHPSDRIGGEPPERLRENPVVVGVALLGPGALVFLFAGLEWIVVVAPLTLIGTTVFLGVRNGHPGAAAAAVLSPFVFAALVLLGPWYECIQSGPSCPTTGAIVRGVVGATLVGGSALIVASRPRRASDAPESAGQD
jgi:hypothetical protein